MPCVRYGLTPRRVVSSRLAAHERHEGLAQHAPRWRRSGWSDESRRCLRFFAGSHRLGPCNRLDGGCRRSTRGFRTSKPRSDTATSAMRLHRDVPIPGTAPDRYVALDVLAPTIGATRRRCSTSLTPGVHINRERRVIPLGISSKPPQGRSTVTSSPQGRDTAHRTSLGITASLPAPSSSARAVEGLSARVRRPATP